MPYRVVPQPPLPSEADIDTPEMVEAAAAVERNEQDIRMLAVLAEIGMDLARAQGAYAKARLAAATGDGPPLSAGEDPNAAFNKIAQTIRRIIALKGKLTEDANKRRSGLIAERASHRARRIKDHESAVKNALDTALSEAFYADLPVTDSDLDKDNDASDLECEEMLDDAELLLEDLDDYGDWLNRPVGETVAKLCVALGLASDACIKRGDTWLVRRAPTAYETMQAEKPKRPPSPDGEGPTPTGPP